MKIFTSKSELENFLYKKRESCQIGFVPTMGALHEGHLQLIRTSQSQSDITVCSIFVNPTQFNDPKDLEKYPKPVDDDIKKLKDAGCEVLFMPAVAEMYADNEPVWHIELGDLETILEGEFRPGHYQGVTQIVKKLFDAVKPHLAFFGQKDYQQIKVVQRMVEILSLPVKLIMCPIIREPDGLAMSSRNTRLSAGERKDALVLYKSLKLTQDNFADLPVADLKKNAADLINSSHGVYLEYFEICNAETLRAADSKDPESIIALVAARVGQVRLIDNLILK